MEARGGAITADVHPTLTPDHGRGLGTMRFQVVARQGDRLVASPGIETRRGRGSGGLSDDVHRVSVRADDSFLGMLTEMYGQPYIWASAGGTDRTHQSERLEGSDCADLMVYGARRAGLAVPYGWTGSLEQHARVLAKGALADDGVYRDGRGKAVAFTRPGDLVLFPRHVGALVEDRGLPGVLDRADIMMHTLFDSPKHQAIADSGYADNPIKILRWKAVR
jgi:cell wall-associated NlpC family hydrolase